jgi:hypothetical protein
MRKTKIELYRIYWELVGLASSYENRANKLKDNGLDEEAETLSARAYDIENACYLVGLVLDKEEDTEQGGTK